MAMHDKQSGARTAFKLPANCHPADYGAATCLLLGWRLDAGGKAWQSPADNIQMQLLLCQQQLAASKLEVNNRNMELSTVKHCVGQLQTDANAAAARLRSMQ